MSILKFIVPTAALAVTAFAAKTDLSGCHFTTVSLLTEVQTQTVDGTVQYEGSYTTSAFWWWEEGQEQCQMLDCGGGRAPPKTDVPGCPYYTGTGDAATVESIGMPEQTLTLPANHADGASATATVAAPVVTETAAPETAIPAAGQQEEVADDDDEDTGRPNTSPRASTRTTTVPPRETGETENNTNGDEEGAALASVQFPGSIAFAFSALLALSAGFVL